MVLLDPCLDKLDVIILTEINVKEVEIALYDIPNYELYWNTRETRRGGGILFYYRKNHNFTASSIVDMAGEYIHAQLHGE